MKNKKRSLLLISLFLLTTLLVTSLVASVYFFNINSTGYYLITNEPLQLEFSVPFVGDVIDTTDSNITIIDIATIYNSGDWLWTNASVEIIKTDLTNGTCDFENDCNITITAEWNEKGDFLEVYDGKTVCFKENNSYIRTYVSCERFSCEQNISVSVTFVPDFDRETPPH